MASADSSDKPAGKPGSGQDEPAADTETRTGEFDKPLKTREIGGPAGPDPTRYGDWERKGRCIDF